MLITPLRHMAYCARMRQPGPIVAQHPDHRPIV